MRSLFKSKHSSYKSYNRPAIYIVSLLGRFSTFCNIQFDFDGYFKKSCATLQNMNRTTTLAFLLPLYQVVSSSSPMLTSTLLKWAEIYGIFVINLSYHTPVSFPCIIGQRQKVNWRDGLFKSLQEGHKESCSWRKRTGQKRAGSEDSKRVGVERKRHGTQYNRVRDVGYFDPETPLY